MAHTVHSRPWSLVAGSRWSPGVTRPVPTGKAYARFSRAGNHSCAARPRAPEGASAVPQALTTVELPGTTADEAVNAAASPCSSVPSGAHALGGWGLNPRVSASPPPPKVNHEKVYMEAQQGLRTPQNKKNKAMDSRLPKCYACSTAGDDVITPLLQSN